MSTRVVRLAGVTNFRDFGGYRTRNGGRIVTGRLYRSAHFNAATAEDIAALEALGVRFLVDLRHPDERASTPNAWSPSLTMVRSPAPDAPSTRAPSQQTGAIARAIMQSTHARIPYDASFVALFGELFRFLAESGGPMIVHCSVGKDRTGIACALVLETLGAGRADIFADYLATNALLDRVDRARRVREQLEPLHGPLGDDDIEPVIGVEASYLQASLDAIEGRSGSIGAYVETVLGVTAPMQARLRAHLVSGAGGDGR